MDLFQPPKSVVAEKENSPPRKRSKREDSEKDSTTEPTAAIEKKPAKEKPQRTSAAKKEAPHKRESATEQKADNEEDGSLKAAIKDNPLLQRPLASVENKVKYGSAANDPATYKKVMKKNFKGETKLHEACQRGYLDKAKEWLQMGSDPNTCDNASLRPIHEHGVIQVRQHFSFFKN